MNNGVHTNGTSKIVCTGFPASLDSNEDASVLHVHARNEEEEGFYTPWSASQSDHVVSPEALLDQQQISPVVFCGVLLYAPESPQHSMITY